MTGSQGEDGPSTSTLQSCYLAFGRFDDVVKSKVIINGTDSYCRRQALLLSHTFGVQTLILILKAHLL